VGQVTRPQSAGFSKEDEMPDRRVLDALAAGRFWVFPPGDDTYRSLLEGELAELEEAIAIADSKPSRNLSKYNQQPKASEL
jgi:hypothetical protein